MSSERRKARTRAYRPAKPASGLWGKFLKDAEEMVKAEAVQLEYELGRWKPSENPTRSRRDIENDMSFLVAHDGRPIAGAVWLYARRLARATGNPDLGVNAYPED